MKFFYIGNSFKNNIFLFLVIIYSFFINIYYANIGTFPIDSFLHFDSSYRILNGEYPVRDYWIVSGFIVDFIQSLFFKFFGINWNSYIIHASTMNVIVSVFTYYFINELVKDKKISLIYTLCFATLAYTISGTPFVDIHASFFLLISTYLIINFFKNPKKFYLWPIIIFISFLSFLSKQVPFVYVTMLQGLFVFFIIVKQKSFKALIAIVLSLILTIIIFYIFLFFLKIDLKLFYIQYFDHPIAIGSSRFTDLNISLENFLNKYKFLIFLIIILTFFEFKININKKKNHITFFLIIFLSIGLIYHQILTKNQIFIYFLIPLYFGLLHSEIFNSNLKNKSLLNILLIFTVIMITVKYHYRFNENRKFHELNKKLVNQSLPASKIDKIFDNLEWINPFFKGTPEEEIKILKQAKVKLNNKNQEIMLISHYAFLDTITEKKMNFPNRTFTDEGISYPVTGVKLREIYKNFLKNKIKANSIRQIYFFKHEKLSRQIIEKNISARCLDLEEDNIFLIYDIKCLD